MSRDGCYENADWLISPLAAQSTRLPIERTGKDGEAQRDRAGKNSILTHFFVIHATREASACEKHFCAIWSDSPYSPETTGGTYIFQLPKVKGTDLSSTRRSVTKNVVKF